MSILVVEPSCVSLPRCGLSNRLAHVASTSIASFASPRLTQTKDKAHCVFYAPPGANLSTTQVGTRVDSCQLAQQIETQRTSDTRPRAQKMKAHMISGSTSETSRERDTSRADSEPLLSPSGDVRKSQRGVHSATSWWAGSPEVVVSRLPLVASGITSKARATSRPKSVGAACPKQLKCRPTQITEVTGIDKTRESLVCASPQTKSTADHFLERSRSQKNPSFQRSGASLECPRDRRRTTVPETQSQRNGGARVTPSQAR